jgi:hypothetical protein
VVATEVFLKGEGAAMLLLTTDAAACKIDRASNTLCLMPMPLAPHGLVLQIH